MSSDTANLKSDDGARLESNDAASNSNPNVVAAGGQSTITRGLKRTQEEWDAKKRARDDSNNPNVVATEAQSKITRGLKRTQEEWDAKRRARDEPTNFILHPAVPHLSGVNRNQGTTSGETARAGDALPQLQGPDADELRDAFDDLEAPEMMRSFQEEAEAAVSDHHHRSPATSATGGSTTGLAEAIPILGVSSREVLQEAQQVDPAQLQKRLDHKEQKERECRRIGYGLVTVFSVILAVALGVGLTRQKDASADTTTVTEAPTDSPTTMSPSAPPSTTLDFFLESLPPSTVDNIFRAETPQDRAYLWLTNHPNIPHLPQWRMTQLFAMATFYYAFEGPMWFKGTKTDWLDYEKDECNWLSGEYGDFCGAGTGYTAGEDPNPTCNSNQEFQALNLVCMQLGGLSPSIPPEIALLTSLDRIRLKANDINASASTFFPTEMSLLGNLTELNVGENHLAGLIPSELGSLTALTSLHVWENELTGQIPSELGKLTALTQLSLDMNQLTGPIPTELGSLKALFRLWLNDNLLTGRIPSELARLSALAYLHLSNNQLVGAVHSELGKLDRLWALYLSNLPLLVGSIPPEIWQLPDLVYLNISGSPGLYGSIPEEICYLRNPSMPCTYDNGWYDENCSLDFDCSATLCGCDCGCSSNSSHA